MSGFLRVTCWGRGEQPRNCHHLFDGGLSKIFRTEYLCGTLPNRVFFENRRQRVLFFRADKVSMRTVAEALLPANGSHANASTTECLWHEGAQGPEDLGYAPTETEWRRTDAEHVSTDTVNF